MSSASGLKDKSGNDQHVHTLEDAKNMNNATAKLNLSSVNDELSMEEDEGNRIPGIAAHVQRLQLLGDHIGRARRIGDQHHRLAQLAKRRQRIATLLIGRPAIMDHPPHVTQNGVIMIGNIGEGMDDSYSHGP